ncbi:SDR family NAD(P)-dependent oxidoreductase [Glutamicibacter sp. JL.03c]|uniref:SDR family NAD(P)-dependent oxidoreductase n=1 Tax=Glutamicibacter sp. JL.03c TaxID=2984842 RepID=UPI0021F77E77|nr:SDR family NAD(P)-dependent oxidoreductase [Glutamicibacter sp. JL.03c]UYQ76791.1 SDR family NAD(P)-dependent oxidoreductase [Glutamicibacter sp. JL.03c]
MNRAVRLGSLEQLGQGLPQANIHGNRDRWKSLGDGKTAVVTGANAGLGFFASLGLAAAGAHVVLACRNQSRAERAMAAIRSRVPGASVEFMQFDADSLMSAMALAAELRGRQLDILVANAGMIRPPSARETGLLGYERTMTANVLGHARLIGELAEKFRQGSLRLITLGSMSTLLLRTDAFNLKLEVDYHPYRAYVQSKAVLQSLGIGLDHRLRQLQWPARSIAVHPGYSVSGLTPQVEGINEPGFAKRLAGRLQAGFAQGKHEGSVAIVEAALTKGLDHCAPGTFFGPQLTAKGRISLARPASITRSKKLQDAAWEIFVKANEGLDPFAL